MALAGLLAAAVLATAPPGDCAGDPPLEYTCGPVKPEDVLALPGTRWLVTSGFAPGAGLKLVDGETGGRLLLTGMRLDESACGGLRKVVNGVADPMLCHRTSPKGSADD